MTAWLRYVRILTVCWRAAISTELEYRLNFVSNGLLSLFWMFWAAAGVSVYFQFTGGLAGWTYPELLVVIGLFFTVNGLRQMLFQPNLERMSEYVRRGTLDFLLIKPVNPQLLVSLRHIGIHNALDPLLGLGLTLAALVLTGRAVTPRALASFVLVFAAAVILLYALMLSLMALAVILVGAEEIDQIAFGAVELARFPVQMYRNPLQTLLTVVPVVFLTTFPAQALLGRLDAVLLFVCPAVSLVAVTVATLLWRRSLRLYSGASA